MSVPKALRAFVRVGISLVVLPLALASVAHAQVYVKAGATGLNDGTSWTNAYTTLELAIASAPQDSQLWVAAATYKPPTLGGYLITKRLKLYGGFRGNESSLQTRKGYFLQTILDGDIAGTPFNPQDDVFHVIDIELVPGASAGLPGVVIDGFLITHGYAKADPVTSHKGGGGILSMCSDLDMANCFVRMCDALNGGGLYFGCTGVQLTTPHNLHIKLSEFNSDVADERGGGIYATIAQGEIVNTQFMNDLGNIEGGGAYITGMDLNWSPTQSLDFTNCYLWNNFNTAPGSHGGGICLGDQTSVGAGSKIVNCSFAFNYTNNCIDPNAGQAVFVSSHSICSIRSSILWFNESPQQPCSPFVSPIAGSATVTYSDIQGGWTGAGIISGDPLFVNVSVGNLTLTLTPTVHSPCIDAADYSWLPNDNMDVDADGITNEIIPLDLAGQPRWADQLGVNDTGTGTFSYLDMGVYEHP